MPHHPHPQPQQPQPHPQQQQQQQQPVGGVADIGGPISPSAEQVAKLNRDLQVVTGNVRVFNEMLNELSPSCISPEDLSLMQELYRTCRAMQQRIMELLEQVRKESSSALTLLIEILQKAFETGYLSMLRFSCVSHATTRVLSPSEDNLFAHSSSSPAFPSLFSFTVGARRINFGASSRQ